MTFSEKIRVWSRFIRFGFFTFGIVSRVYINSFRKSPLEKGLRIRQQWALGSMGGIYNFRADIKGKLPEGQHLYVSNHRASIDPIIYLQYIKAFPVSRADVEHYPLVGRGAKTVGTLFVNKTNRVSRAETRKAIEQEFRNGNSILLFPEGRTHAENLTIRLHIGAFRAAAETNTPVFPMAIDYQNQNDYWTHEDSFLTHFNAQFGRRYETQVKVRFGDPIPAGDPEVMMQTARDWIDKQILEMREEWAGTQIMRESK